MDGCMHACMDGWMAGWVDGWMGGLVDGRMDACMHACMYVHKERDKRTPTCLVREVGLVHEAADLPATCLSPHPYGFGLKPIAPKLRILVAFLKLLWNLSGTELRGRPLRS